MDVAKGVPSWRLQGLKNQPEIARPRMPTVVSEPQRCVLLTTEGEASCIPRALSRRLQEGEVVEAAATPRQGARWYSWRRSELRDGHLG